MQLTIFLQEFSEKFHILRSIDLGLILLLFFRLEHVLHGLLHLFLGGCFVPLDGLLGELIWNLLAAGRSGPLHVYAGG